MWVYKWHKTHKYIHCGGIKNNNKIKIFFWSIKKWKYKNKIVILPKKVAFIEEAQHDKG